MLCTNSEVSGGYLDGEFGVQNKRSRTHDEKWNDKLDSSQYEALLKGGEQVTSVLQEMITLVGLSFSLCVFLLVDSGKKLFCHLVFVQMMYIAFLGA